MKIGIFDSGLGGLVVAKSVIKKLPKYDLIYLGDTKRVPYGNRSQQAVFEFTVRAVEYLFQQGCKLVIIACNTASAQALRRIQRELLPKKYPDRKVLGVIIPTLETVGEDKKAKRVGILATQSTVSSHIYQVELKKINAKLQVKEQAAPLLVPLIENGAEKFTRPFVREYLKPLKAFRLDSLVLGCTHYPLLKKIIAHNLPKKVKIYSQEEIIPKKLADYLNRHPEIQSTLSQKGRHTFVVTDLNVNLDTVSRRLFRKKLPFVLADF